MDTIEKLKYLDEMVYKLCDALVSICDMECCRYGFDEAYAIASRYLIEADRYKEEEHE